LTDTLVYVQTKRNRSTRKAAVAESKETNMTWIKNTFKTWPLFLVLLTGLVLVGCEGTDSREKVDDTVKEFSGQKNLERMEQMKKDIAVIKKQQADRLKKLQ
jgi:hypothetical protein